MKTLKRFGLYSYAKYKFNSKEFAYTFAKLIQIKSVGLPKFCILHSTFYICRMMPIAYIPASNKHFSLSFLPIA